LLAWVWMVFNSFVDLRQRVRQAWSLVDIQLKRRFDLIPNLVDCVKGYRDHEAQLQEELARLRTQLTATPPGVAGPDHGAVGQTIVAIAERYPELKANDAFLSLQKTLSDTEQRIALARSYFNEIATHFNTRLEIVPEGWVARLGAMKPQPLMAANDFERAPVTVALQPN
ncbi:MAG TPA: LemA family protein, partial [Verrucomicrobiae bacterium]